MSKILKRPEVLSPAGTLEKLKVAIDYGADAVVVGGQAFGLRSREGNFTVDDVRGGIEYALCLIHDRRDRRKGRGESSWRAAHHTKNQK
ncbi:peptidase U32 family protein, partial [Streptococcus hyovaginalis]